MQARGECRAVSLGKAPNLPVFLVLLKIFRQTTAAWLGCGDSTRDPQKPSAKSPTHHELRVITPLWLLLFGQIWAHSIGLAPSKLCIHPVKLVLIFKKIRLAGLACLSQELWLAPFLSYQPFLFTCLFYFFAWKRQRPECDSCEQMNMFV